MLMSRLSPLVHKLLMFTLMLVLQVRTGLYALKQKETHQKQDFATRHKGK